jgi:hypothetical protein
MCGIGVFIENVEATVETSNVKENPKEGCSAVRKQHLIFET